MPGPTFRAAAVRVQVPATAANLGPGFDALGLALSLHNDVVARVSDSGLSVDIAGEGAETLRRDRRNLVVQSMRATFDLLGGQPRGLELVCANRIPSGRGLGSSAAAIVAGVCLARELVLGGLPDADALELAARLEGHPDNVAAALLGGLTLAWVPEGGGARAERLALSDRLSPVAFVPTAMVSTHRARSALPVSVPLADVVTTLGRAALLVHALGERPELLLTATEDVLHQPPRLASQPRGAQLVARLREAGVAAVLSGSGPSVLALATDSAQAELAMGLAGRWFEACPLPVDRHGAQVVAL